MKEIIVSGARATGQGALSVVRGLRRGVIATCAVVAMLVIYGISSVGTYVGVAGLSTLALATSATPADARRRRRRRRRWRRRRRGWGIWFGPRRRRRRRRRWRRRRRRGIYLYW
jgi:hypothetical protein